MGCATYRMARGIMWQELLDSIPRLDQKGQELYAIKGLPPNLRNHKGDTLLMLAAYHGHVETVKVLLENQADPEIRNDNGQSPIAGAAFKGDLAFAGHYGGFRVVDLSDPGSPVVLSDVHCNGPQGDVTVYGDLLFLSVDTPQSTEGCEGSRNVTAKTEGAFEGVRVFDISDPAAPVFLDQKDCAYTPRVVGLTHHAGVRVACILLTVSSRRDCECR